MNRCGNETELRRRTLEIGIIENEGGAAVSDTPNDRYYGRRIEADRSWTVYHVFTGVPARMDGNTMTGLSQSEATDSLLSLNRRGARRGKERITRPTSAPNAPQPGYPS